MNFEKLPFTGDYKKLLGEPSPNFFLILSSDAGVGKSTWSLKFANYLAKSFGQVIYMSNEEGISLTLQKKVNLIQTSLSENALACGWKNFETARRLLQTSFKDFRFVFIDSLDYAKLTNNQIEILRTENSDKAFIGICQRNKKGEIKGSSDRSFDSDIIIEVYRDADAENVYAKTTKNRFLETGKEMKVF